MTLRAIVRAAAFLLLYVPFATRALATPQAPSYGGWEHGEYEFTSWDAQILVRSDGSLSVAETVGLRFSILWKGVYQRSFPLVHRTSDGFEYRWKVRIESVTDSDLTPLQYRYGRIGDSLNLAIELPATSHANRTLVITYLLENGVRFLPDRDEFYWNVTGNDHFAGIFNVGATVILPDGAAGLKAEAFTDFRGSAESSATIEALPAGWQIAATRPLRGGEGLAVVASWQKGFVHPTVERWAFLKFILDLWPLAIPLIALIVSVYVYKSYGSDPQLRPITVQYEPPDDLSPAGAAALISSSPGMREIMATLVDLAVRGYVYIEVRWKDEAFGLVTEKDYSFQLAKPLQYWATLRAHERMVLSLLIGGGRDIGASQTLLPVAHNEFLEKVPLIRETILEELRKRGYYRAKPLTSTLRLLGYLYLFLFGLLALAGYWGQGSRTVQISYYLSAALTLLIMYGFSWLVARRRTLDGTRALEKVLGFKEFLFRVEAARLNSMCKFPETFEKLLPYAMAFDCMDQWSRVFDGIYTQPPQWYVGGHYGPAFHPSALATALSAMAAHAESAEAARRKNPFRSLGLRRGGNSAGAAR